MGASVSESIGAIADYAKEDCSPRLVAGFLIAYLGNPVVFIAYISSIFNFFRGTNQDGVSIFGFKTFKEVSTNVTRMNPIFYILFTLPLYVAWIVLNVVVLPKLFWSRHFNVDLFLGTYSGLRSVGAFIVALPNVLNLYVWCTSGMEGNVMGFFFALPLLVATVFYFVMWILAILHALESAADISGLYAPAAIEGLV